METKGKVGKEFVEGFHALFRLVAFGFHEPILAE
jgi:hypothetical protein